VVEGVLAHVNVERDILARNAARQWLLIAERHVPLYCGKEKHGESVAMLLQVWKIHFLCDTVSVNNVPECAGET